MGQMLRLDVSNGRMHLFPQKHGESTHKSPGIFFFSALLIDILKIFSLKILFPKKYFSP